MGLSPPGGAPSSYDAAMGKAVVVVAFAAFLFACGSNEVSKQKDGGVAGQACDFDPDCDGAGQVCQDGRCVQLCDMGAGEFLCNTNGSSPYPPQCCHPDQVCCVIRYPEETETCHTGGECPPWRNCPRADNWQNSTCVGSYCLYTAPPVDAGSNTGDGGPQDAGTTDDAGGDDGGPEDGDAGAKDAGSAGACVAKWDDRCIGVCPPEDMCGNARECCGEGTHCDQGCCVLD